MKKIALGLFIGAIAFTACNKAPKKGYQTSPTGVRYHFYVQNDKGVSPKVGDVVELEMLYKNNKDSVLFNSRKVSRDSNKTLKFALRKSAFKGSVEAGLMMMHEGDSASFKVNADSLFLKTFRMKKLPPKIQSGSDLTFYIKLIKVTSHEEAMKERQEQMKKRAAMMNKMKASEPGRISKYLTDNHITVKPDKNGIYFLSWVKGKGRKIQKGDSVQVGYTGKFMDGTVFDKSDKGEHTKPFVFKVGVGAVVKGWDDALLEMREGGKAEILLPSSLAYGSMGAGGMIAPYTPLIFDMHVVRVVPAKKK